MSNNNSLIKSAGLIGFATVCSRILGFVRDIVIAKFFGTGIFAEAFFVAFRIPNLLRELVGEGAANAAFVPVFTEYLVQKDKTQLERLIQTMFKILFLVLSTIVVVGIFFSSPLVKIIAPGFVIDSAKFSLTVRLTQIMFIYLLFIGLTAYLMSILHTFKHFFTPAFGPCLLNISLIFSAIFFFSKLKEPVYSLAIGVLLGGAMQFAIQTPPIFRKKISFRLFSHSLHFTDPGVKKVFKLLLPRLFGSAVYQLNVFVDTICASLAEITGIGAVAAIYYANRIIQFPLAVFGIALSTVILPSLSHAYSSNNFGELNRTLILSLRTIILFLLPCGILLFVLSRPIVCIFFERGNFSSYSTSITSQTLLFYCFGLIFYGGTKILISGFHSLQDTKTPVKIASICLLINLLLNLILMFPLKVGGIALASSISSLVNFLTLFYLLKKRIKPLEFKPLFIFFLRVLLLGLLCGMIVYSAWNFLFINILPILRLIICGILALLSFFIGCAILRIKEVDLLWRLKEF